MPLFSELPKRALAIVASGSIAAGLATLYFQTRLPAIPHRPLRIGFESNPPVQIRTAKGYSGLAVETVSEAAQRAGIQLEWVDTGLSSEESLRKGLVDLWPLMVNLPSRRKYIHFARPWMHSNFVLLLGEGSAAPGPSFAGRLSAFDVPLHVRFIHERFPAAEVMIFSELRDVVKQVCEGRTTGAFLEGRAALVAIREKPLECASSGLRVQAIPNMTFQAGIASSFEAAGAAEAIQAEIEKMFRDGTLAALIGKYSYFGLDDTWVAYDLLQSLQTTRWMAAGVTCLALVAALSLWQASALRQRKRAEAVLRESEERFRSMADTAPVMIWSTGADKNFTFFNKTWLHFRGRTLEQELGFGWAEGIHPDDLERCVAGYNAAFDARKNFQIECRLRRADGEYRWVLCSGVPRNGADGTFSGYVGSDVDLTDLRRAQEEALERQNLESLGVMAGGIAHDFNNLLGGVLAYSELAQGKLRRGGCADDELQHIRSVAIRGAEIVRQLMIYAGHERGVLEPVDVSAVVGEMLELLKVSISKHAILKTRLPVSLPAVQANPAQIRQVVMNLVTNASEAIGERDGVIEVITEHATLARDSTIAGDSLSPGDYLRLEVSDSGQGMSAETLSRIFDPFFTTKFAGRGMGLAVVRAVVRGHGGAISASSAPGQGTRFQIWLPCASTNVSAPARTLSELSPEPLALSSGSILVVEDEVTLRGALSQILCQNGFSVAEASNGSAALNMIRRGENHFDAMLLDITLPGVSSLEVYEEVRHLRPELKVILTSAYSQDSVAALFSGHRIGRFIRKPFQVADLVAMLREAINDADRREPESLCRVESPLTRARLPGCSDP